MEAYTGPSRPSPNPSPEPQGFGRVRGGHGSVGLGCGKLFCEAAAVGFVVFARHVVDFQNFGSRTKSSRVCKLLPHI